jgi:hypothetical protein
MSELKPHVADKIEPGAILYSSWGYDQTNIDFYMVTRTTAKSAWIVPMSSPIVDQVGWLAEHVTAGEPQWFSKWCECRHVVGNHGMVLNMAGDDYPHCRGSYGDDCDCHEIRPVPNVPKMHRINRTTYGETLHLTSYSSASLWEGRKLYTSHYA